MAFGTDKTGDNKWFIIVTELNSRLIIVGDLPHHSSSSSMGVNVPLCP